jgi:putative spermidine/putrescine transport system permease protein
LNLLLIPFLMGEIVRAFGWHLILGRNGVIPWLLGVAGVDEVRMVGTWYGLLPGMIQVMMPISALVMLPAIRRIAPDLEGAAATLGARPWGIWRYVIIPMARPGIVAAAAVSFTLSMTEFAIPQVLGVGRQTFVANAIQNIYFLQNNIYQGSAFAMILVVVVTIAVVLLVRFGRGWSVEG